jgi:hypothetical protein
MSDASGEAGLIAQVFMWATGGIASGLSIVLAFLFGKVASLQRQVDRGALDSERRFALRVDMEKLREHVDARFDRMEQSQEQTRTQIMDELRRSRRV